MFAVATNHGFVDGNKRTALFAMDLLLRRSGYQLRTDDLAKINDEVEKMILDVVEDRMSDRELVDWFTARIVQVDLRPNPLGPQPLADVSKANRR